MQLTYICSRPVNLEREEENAQAEAERRGLEELLKTLFGSSESNWGQFNDPRGLIELYSASEGTLLTRVSQHIAVPFNERTERVGSQFRSATINVADLQKYVQNTFFLSGEEGRVRSIAEQIKNYCQRQGNTSILWRENPSQLTE